jgi:uncharacterized protein YcaQ
MTAKQLTVTREAARRFLVARHFLAPPRSLQGGPDAVMEVFRRLGSIQFDPLAVAGRNHDLVLHARVAGYDPTWCEELLYRRRELFETQNKGLSLLPTTELPWYRVSWAQSRDSPRMFHAAVEPLDLEEHRELATQIMDQIRAEGPLTALDFESGRTANWFGTPMSLASAVLDKLAATGALGLARREGNRRHYDLIERLFPADLLGREVPPREQLRHKMLSRFRAHGLLGVYGPAMIGLGPAKPDPKRPERPSRTELRDALVESGEIVPVEIEGVRGARFAVRDEVDLLIAPPEPAPSVAFLPPFDPLVWDVAFLGKLFDFEYVLELYHPEPKRRWGYYVLPLLFRDRLVARIEPRIDRGAGRVRVLGLWWEEGFDTQREEGFVEAMREALRAYMRFAGATELEWAPHLSREKRLFLTRP